MEHKVVAVIPALNEEATIEGVLISTKRAVDEIVVVDDCSSDRTSEISKRYAVVVRHNETKGYDIALSDGFEMAKKIGATIIVSLDADGQHIPRDIEKLVSLIKHDKADVVVGKRPFRSRFMEGVFAHFGRRYGIEDPLCGLKAYAIRVYDDVGFFDNVSSIGTQLAFVAKVRGYRLGQVPISLRKRKDVPRFGRKLKANYKLFKALMRIKKYLKVNENGN
jgi:glycosyltransferase involved in cell wall biosynthesis